jgi:hypothetical protein
MPFRRGVGTLDIVAMEDGKDWLLSTARWMPLDPGSGILQLVAMEDGGDFLVDGCPFVVAAEFFTSWRWNMSKTGSRQWRNGCGGRL